MKQITLDKSDKRHLKAIFDSIMRTLFKEGRITLDDFKNDEQLWQKIQAINKNADWTPITDHSEELISTARHYASTEDYNKAKLFYATYFEHELNRLIIEKCTRKKIGNKTRNEIIKSVTIIGKLTWLPLLLDIPPVIDKHKNVILKVADERNAFVHYKHNPEPEEAENRTTHKRQEDVKQIERTITYFKKYLGRISYSSQKTLLDRELRKRNYNHETETVTIP